MPSLQSHDRPFVIRRSSDWKGVSPGCSCAPQLHLSFMALFTPASFKQRSHYLRHGRRYFTAGYVPQFSSDRWYKCSIPAALTLTSCGQEYVKYAVYFSFSWLALAFRCDLTQINTSLLQLSRMRWQSRDSCLAGRSWDVQTRKAHASLELSRAAHYTSTWNGFSRRTGE